MLSLPLNDSPPLQREITDFVTGQRLTGACVPSNVDAHPGGNQVLVLTRKLGEAIVIGEDVRLTVLSIAPGRVKIGIEAPPHVAVDRVEVREKRKADRSADHVIGTEPIETSLELTSRRR
jgi:carbon storage regulator